MDVKITLLNVDLDKEVYMKQSDRFVINGQEKFVSLSNHYIVSNKYINNNIKN